MLGNLREFFSRLDAWSVVVGIASLFTALVIFWRQRIAQASLNNLIIDVRARFFGTIEGSESLYNKAIEILTKANESPKSDLGIMLYWLWFGADSALKENSYKLSKLRPNDSEIRRLLAKRREDGYHTTVVILKPDGDRMRDFLGTLRSWREEECREETIEIPALGAQATDPDVSDCVAAYSRDVEDFCQQISNTRSTRFERIALKDAIPMIMFALKKKREGGACCLVCLNETETLTSRADVGGFYSEDSKIVDIVYEQIIRMVGVVEKQRATDEISHQTKVLSTEGVCDPTDANTGECVEVENERTHHEREE